MFAMPKVILKKLRAAAVDALRGLRLAHLIAARSIDCDGPRPDRHCLIIVPNVGQQAAITDPIPSS